MYTDGVGAFHFFNFFCTTCSVPAVYSCSHEFSRYPMSFNQPDVAGMMYYLATSPLFQEWLPEKTPAQKATSPGLMASLHLAH